jgi:hypothetical protein
MLKRTVAFCALAITAAAMAKLPPPTPQEQETLKLNAAKAAHTAKVDAYKLCLSQNKVAEAYLRDQKAAGKAYTPESTPACADPGPFVAPAAAPAAAAPAQPASMTAAPAPKK